MTAVNRREFVKSLSGIIAISGIGVGVHAAESEKKPNVVLIMCDDLGWGDTGYNGNRIIRTPHLDAMSREGIRFDRFYAAAPVCSPTRGSCITGRHPYRYGIFFANTGHMRKQEVTLAEALRPQGYATGHFGKWHLGTLTTKIKDANRGRPGKTGNYAPPWDNGFDACFSTESKVPTYDPMVKPKGKAPGRGWDYIQEGGDSVPYGTYYWDGPEHRVSENLEGDDSRVIMDRAVPFIQECSKADKPFLAVIWFHTPHLPVVAGPRHAEMYKTYPTYEKNYYGCVTAMDEQVGRLRAVLEQAGVADNTMVWFASDNGPEGKAGRAPGSAGPLRGRKRSLYEGGVRVPGLLVWPDRVQEPRTLSVPCCTSDYFPTVLGVLGHRLQGAPEPVDGVSLLPLIDGAASERPVPLGFQSQKQLALIEDRYKLYSSDAGKTFELYDIPADPGEKQDLAEQNPDVVATMKATLVAWKKSCKNSFDGNDYQ